MYKLQCQTCEDGCIRPQLFLSGNLPSRFIKALEELGYTIRKLPPYKNLAEPVASHPDMLICQVDERLFLPKDYYEENKTLFDEVDATLIDISLQPKYPGDVCFNALVMGNTVYGRTDVICDSILKCVPNHVFVKQGYAACSTLLIGKNAAVTADRTIAKALIQNGVDVCLIEQGNIVLDGYNCGFIGGASIKLSGDCVAFFGDIKYHPSHEKIREFANAHNVRLIALSDEPLIDFGGGKCYNIYEKHEKET